MWRKGSYKMLDQEEALAATSKAGQTTLQKRMKAKLDGRTRKLHNTDRKETNVKTSWQKGAKVLWTGPHGKCINSYPVCTLEDILHHFASLTRLNP